MEVRFQPGENEFQAKCEYMNRDENVTDVFKVWE